VATVSIRWKGQLTGLPSFFSSLPLTPTRTLALVLLGCGAAVSSANARNETSACAVEKYELISLPLRPASISEVGSVAGTSDDHRAAFWSARAGLKTIDVPAGFQRTEGVSINQEGEVLVTASTADGSQRRSFRYLEGVLRPLPGERSRGAALNDAAEVAGEALVPGKAATVPVLWTKGSIVDLGACCGGAASALNQRGQVAGQAYDQDARYQAFLWDAAHGLKIIGSPEVYSSAASINDAGHVLLEAFTQGSFLYRDGALVRLELSKQWPSHPRALNNCDVVVGSFGSNADQSHAFVWDARHGFRDLNDLVQHGSGWTLEGAVSINNRGEIVGWGDHQGKEDAGFLLEPAK